MFSDTSEQAVKKSEQDAQDEAVHNILKEKAKAHMALAAMQTMDAGK